MRKTLGLLGAFALLTGCPVEETECDTNDTATDCSECDSTDSTCDTGGIDEYTGDVSIGIDEANPSYPTNSDDTVPDAMAWGCWESTYWYDFYTIGWSGGGLLSIHQTGSDFPWYEYGHVVPSVNSDLWGWWDNLFLELPSVTDMDDVQINDPANGVVGATLFQCDGAMEYSLSFFLVVADYEGNAVDCRVWGDDPSYWAEYCTDVWN